ncbi:MAG: nucleoside triphosphate pyrophosphohydrolase [Actinobacteria bacterium]|nr:nucleoside triphosphate pyrophosphohydrolase [Actinomycetota bacterium]
MARIVVVGLGPGDPARVTTGTLDHISRTTKRFIRTIRHPSAHLVLHAEDGAESFDHLYDSSNTFDEVYSAITERLVSAARQFGEVLYAVPGSPLVLEKTVRNLLALTDIDVHVEPAISFLDDAWRALAIDPVEIGVRLIDGHDFAAASAGYTGPMLVAHTHANWVLSDIKLSVDDVDDTPVTLLHHLGLDDECVVHTTWSDIDRAVDADHLTCLWIPGLASSAGHELVRFHQLARTLREQCPWDKEQTHKSLVTYLLEETYEVVDAINSLREGDTDGDDELVEELGDLLYQIEFHAVIAEQEGRFSMADVARRVHDKLVRRHPHVFADTTVNDTTEVLKNWEQLKAEEKPHRTGLFDGVVEAAPSLSFALKVQQRASRAGFDWPNVDGALDKVAEEAREVAAARDEDPEATFTEIGDLFFAVVNIARHLDIDPEAALRGAVQKFRRRVERVEQLARNEGASIGAMTLEELDRLWELAKQSD